MLQLNKHIKAKPKPKTNTQLRTAHILCVCISLCTPVVHNTEQNSCDNFPVVLQTFLIAQMTSTEGEGQFYILQ